MKDLTVVIGKNLAQLRHQKKLSLDKLSEISNVSKAMLGQIERAESNPTVNTLWKIASGLRVPFNRLIATNNSKAELVRFSEIESIGDTDGMTVFPQFSFNQESDFEIFLITLDPQCSHLSDPHDINSEEYVLLIDGNLEIEVGGQNYQLTPGDGIHFQSDQLHTYRNLTDKMVRFQNIINHH